MENRESSTAKARLLFVANTSWYLYNFRLSLAKYLRAKGLEIIMVAPHDEFTSCLVDEGFRVVDWNVVRSSVNPVSELRALILLTGIYRRLEPELVHHFTIKACLYLFNLSKSFSVSLVILVTSRLSLKSAILTRRPIGFERAR